MEAVFYTGEEKCSGKFRCKSGGNLETCCSNNKINEGENGGKISSEK